MKQILCTIYFQYYDGSDGNVFFNDLENKDEILLLFFIDKLVGFTTLKNYLIDCPDGFTPLNPYQNSNSLSILFSGDTIVSAQHWGQQALAFAWIRHISVIKSRHAHLPLYWFLLVKGFRTYRYLFSFTKSFFPYWDDNRNDLKYLADYLAFQKYGALYNPLSGIVECPEKSGFLTEQWSSPKYKDLIHPSTQFFLQTNPNYQQGHELVCVCELEAVNFKPFTNRILEHSNAFSE